MNIGTPSKEEYTGMQAYFKSKKHNFGENTGQEIVIPDFVKMLSSFDILILALFGGLDSQVDWRSAKSLYQSSLGENDHLTVSVFPKCNHLMFKAETGAYFEDLKPFNWKRCKGFFDNISNWLKQQKSNASDT